MSVFGSKFKIMLYSDINPKAKFMKKQNDNDIYKKIKEVLIKKAEGFFYDEETLEYVNNEDISIKQSKEKEIVTKISKIERENKSEDNKSIQSVQEKEKLILVKKKTTSHYIPPDMLAIKILLEIYGEKINDDISNLSNNELIALKNKLIKELQNENN